MYETDKTHLLIFFVFFCEQTLSDNHNATIPIIELYTNDTLSTVSVTPVEVESVMKFLPLCKAVGPDDINIHILHELACQKSYPLYYLISQSMEFGISAFASNYWSVS